MPSSRASSRRSTLIGTVFIVLGLCAIACLIGSELFVSFRSEQHRPITFVLYGAPSAVSNGTYDSSTALSALLGYALCPICGSVSNISTSLTNAEDFIGYSLESSSSSSFVSSVETSQFLSVAQVINRLVVDFSPMLVALQDVVFIASSSSSNPSGNISSIVPAASKSSSWMNNSRLFGLVVGYNQSGLLMLGATVDGFDQNLARLQYSFVPSKLTNNNLTMLQLYLRNAVTIGCPFSSLNSNARVGSSWPKTILSI